VRLVERCGGVVDGIAVIMEIEGLEGAKKFNNHYPNIPVKILLSN
jgi:adenine/guanine phosphoribosyltransferase-like PRPP-binding protein